MNNTTNAMNNELINTLKELTSFLENMNYEREEERMVYTPMEAMQKLGVSKHTMYNVLLKDSKFPKFKIGTKILIPKVKLEEWVIEQCN